MRGGRGRWGAASAGTLSAGGADKGTALDDVLKRLNIAPERVMVLGDNHNDLPLFRHAGIRVAVANAIEQLKARATLIAPDHREDGAAWAIRSVLDLS